MRNMVTNVLGWYGEVELLLEAYEGLDLDGDRLTAWQEPQAEEIA